MFQFTFVKFKILIYYLLFGQLSIFSHLFFIRMLDVDLNALFRRLL